MTDPSSTIGQPAGEAQPAVSADGLLEEIGRIRPIIEQYRQQAESERALADQVYDAMIDAGLFRAWAPKAFGGLELHPAEAYRVWEAVAQIDSAAAWNVQMNSGIAAFGGPWLCEQGAQEIYSSGPDTVFAGALFPGGPAIRMDGGWRVSVRAPFASGCHRAQWFALPIVEVQDEATPFDPTKEDPPTVGVFIPRDEVDVVDTWHTAGMRGTFSADVVVDDVFVPDSRVIRLEEPIPGTAAFSGPLYRTMPWPIVHGEACISVGIAQAAVDELIELAARKTPAYSRNVLRDRGMVQHHAAKARALVDASRDYLRSAISNAYADVEAEGRFSEDSRLRCQLAACFAAEACAQAVDLVCDAAGSSAGRLEYRFERHHRDIHFLTKHASKSYARYEDVGKMMFGMAPLFFTLRMRP